MAGLQLKRMNWVRMPSAWEHAMQWREKQQRSKERIAALNAAASGFTSAAQNQISESGALAIRMAITRNQAEAKARAEAAAKLQTNLLA